MQFYRITDKKYARDLEGTGAKLYGGRWNPVGHAVLYTSENPAISAWENLVYFDINKPKNLVLLTLVLPDEKVSIQTILEDDLEDNWKENTMRTYTQEIGKNWLDANENLILKVPSAVIPQSQNILINPLHIDSTFVQIIDIQPFDFDKRILDKINPI